MVTINVLSKELKPEQNLIVVNTTITRNGITEPKLFSFPINFDLRKIKEEVQKYVNNLENGESIVQTLPSGSFDITPTATQEDPAEVEKAAWFQKWNKLIFVDSLIEKGVLTGTEPAVVSLRAAVKTTFKPVFIA